MVCPVIGPGVEAGVIAWTAQWKGTQSASKLPGKYQFAHTLDGETMPVRADDKLIEFMPILFNSSK